MQEGVSKMHIRGVVLLLLMSTVLSAQEDMGYRHYDTLTYNLWKEGKWKELSEAGREALDRGHDYYFMRMRIAISFYERSYYAAAAKHFRKALSFNLNDPVATEYLFYCHLYSGEYALASRLLGKMTYEHSGRVREESGIADNSIWISMYYNEFDTDGIFENPSYWFSGTQPGTLTVSRLLVNPSVSMSHHISPGLYYSHSFNNLTKYSLLDYYDGIRIIYYDDHRVLQNQYWGNLTIAGSKGTSISSWAHLSIVTYDYILTGGSYTPGYYSVLRSRSLHYSLGMNIRQRTGYFAMDASMGLNRFGAGPVFQGDIGVQIYPFGNELLRAGIRSAGVFENSKGPDGIDFINSISAGITFPAAFSVDISYVNGDHLNSVSGNGLYLYNSPDYITSRLQINLSVVLSKKSGLMLNAGGGINNHATRLYSLDNQITEINRIEYSSYNLNGGLLWNF